MKSRDLLEPLLCAPEIEALEQRCHALLRSSDARSEASEPRHDSTRQLLICITPRSGSTWLAALLRNTGVLGYPAEYLNLADDLQAGELFRRITGQRTLYEYIQQAGPMTLRDYWRNIGTQSATHNGCFSAKGDFYQFALLMRAGLFTGEHVRHVYLTREDVVLQAISLFQAEMAGKWSSLHPVTRQQLEFDEDGIVARVLYLIKMMSMWERIFAAYGIRPLRLTYEQIEANPADVLGRIASFTGVSLSPGDISFSSPVARQRDNGSAAWAAEIHRKVLTQLGERLPAAQ